jgi:hypothetical protein
MTLDELLQKYRDQYDIVGMLELDDWHQQKSYNKMSWMVQSLSKLHRSAFEPNQRLLFVLKGSDEYQDQISQHGRIIEALAKTLYTVDISNFFVVLLIVNDPALAENVQNTFRQNNPDTVPITVDTFDGEIPNRIVIKTPPADATYSGLIPNKISLDELTDRERYLLTESSTFCMYPWMHMHLYPTGDAKPCCMSEHQFVKPLGNANQTPMREIWNSNGMKSLRQNMLNNVPSSECTRCYVKEASGFFSGRRSANKHHGHLISRVAETKSDGHLDRFEMAYWDIRFSNLCNLRCRSCGHMFSSSWYQDQVALAGPDYAKEHRPLFYAGRHQTDIWEQLLEHIDHVEQIYFAGGEPLIMEEHYRILEELERREMWHVRLIYNTNFTQVKLKDRYVFDYWKKFNSVAVGASLDAMGARAEYIRKGTVWSTVETNRQRMLDICPGVDFYISPTVSILNALHVPDFHQNWVERGFLRHQDLNVNLVLDPDHLRIDLATPEYKQVIIKRIQEHLDWLRPHDQLKRASDGFESLIRFIQATDNSHLLPQFWEKTQKLDHLRSEDLLTVIPELRCLK